MKKRIMSIILAIAMIMTLLPQTVFAAVYGWGFYKTPDVNASQITKFTVTNEDNKIYFGVPEGETLTGITFDENFDKIADYTIIEDGKFAEITITGVPSSGIEYVLDAKTQSSKIENCVIHLYDGITGLPEAGFYTSSEIIPENLVEEFIITKENNKLYFAVKDIYTLETFSLGEDFEKIADWKMYDNQQVVEITITGEPSRYNTYYVSATTDNRIFDFETIELVDHRPYLKARHASWNQDEEKYYYDASNELVEVWDIGETFYDALTFCFVENGVETPITFEELTVSKPGVIEISDEYGSECVLMKAIGFGSTTIDYVKDGKTYSMDVLVPVPEEGFATAPVINEDTYINEMYIKDDVLTFYYVVSNGLTINDYSISDPFYIDYVRTTLSEDKTYIKFEMSPEAGGGYFMIWTELYRDGYPSMAGERGISINEIYPEVKCRQAEMTANGPVENPESELTNEIYIKNGETAYLYFYYVEGDEETRIPAEEIYVNEDWIVSGTVDKKYPEALKVTGIEEGRSFLYYLIDNRSYGIDVYVEQGNVQPDVPTPEVPAPEVDEETTAKVEDNVDEVVEAIKNNQSSSLGNSVSAETIANIQEAIENNEEIKTEIVVEVMDEADLSETDTYLIQQELSETQQVVQYLDLSVMIKSVTDDGTEKELGTLNELSEEVTFTIAIPEELNVEGREFFVIRVHDGETTILPATMNDDGTISFTTDRFSTYALGYEDVEPPFVPVVPDGVDYAPYYDEATGTFKGIEVGDEVDFGAVFDTINLTEEQYMSIQFLAFEGEGTGGLGWYRVTAGKQFVIDGADANCNAENGFYVSEIESDDNEAIHITLVCKVPPVEISKINIDVNWNEFINFEEGNTIPGYSRYGKLELDKGLVSANGEGIYEGYPSNMMFKVKEEHLQKGYITEYQYNLANESYDGWWEVAYTEGYVFSKDDEYRLMVDMFAKDGYVFTYDSDKDITGKIVISDENVAALETNVGWGSYANMGMRVTLDLGTGAEILQKAASTIKLTGWQLIDGKWYFYDNDGKKVTNQWRKDSKGWCYLGADGAMATNQWVPDSVGYCFVDKNGYMVYNQWCLDDTGWAYAGTDGYRVTNKWVKDSAGWCYLGADGYFVTKSWVKDSVGWCYLNEDGRMVYNSWVADSNGLCYVGKDGYMVTNSWVQHDGKWCYVGSDGYKVTSQWRKDSKGWCYLDEDGFMVTNAWAPDSKGEVYLGSDGYMVTNKWIQVGDKWCYVGSDGYKVTSQWRKDSSGWCYLGKDGFMLTSQWVKDSVGYCYVNSGGYIVYSQWVSIGEDRYYVNSSGYRVENAWVQLEGKWYYFKEEGIMARNETINGDYVDENGIWIPEQ